MTGRPSSPLVQDIESGLESTSSADPVAHTRCDHDLRTSKQLAQAGARLGRERLVGGMPEVGWDHVLGGRGSRGVLDGLHDHGGRVGESEERDERCGCEGE